MGYQITFTPTEEKMKEYKKDNRFSYKSVEELIKTLRREIVDVCLKNREDDIDHKNFQSVETFLEYQIKYFAELLKNDEKASAYERWKDDEDHEIWYCGWEFSHESSLDRDMLINNTVDKLCILASVIKTPSYFEDSEHFYSKWSEIKDELDGFEDCMRDIIIHEIIDDLREFEKKYDTKSDEETDKQD